MESACGMENSLDRRLRGKLAQPNEQEISWSLWQDSGLKGHLLEAEEVKGTKFEVRRPTKALRIHS